MARVELKSPYMGATIKVPEDSVERYEADGWQRVKRGPGRPPKSGTKSE